jgi:HEAT repeat protein
LGEVGPDARGELTPLLASLREGSPALQVAAAYALGEIFAANRAEAPGLVDGLRQASASTEENVAAAARAALKKIQTPM